MTTASTRNVRVRKFATAMALTPTAAAMMAGCTHWRHKPPGDHPGTTGTRPTVPPTTTPPTTAPVTTAPVTTMPVTTIVRPTTTAAVTTVTTRPPTTARPTTVTTAAPQPKTVTGPAVQQQYGPITVTVTVLGNRITNVTATAGVTDPVSVLINNDAIPKLNAEVMAAQNGNIAAVSGATLTSPAYKESLQKALDQAGFRG